MSLPLSMNCDRPAFGGPVPNAKLRVLSLGAGVQSTTLALMAAHGEIGPMPGVAWLLMKLGARKTARRLAMWASK